MDNAETAGKNFLREAIRNFARSRANKKSYGKGYIPHQGKRELERRRKRSEREKEKVEV